MGWWSWVMANISFFSRKWLVNWEEIVNTSFDKQESQTIPLIWNTSQIHSDTMFQEGNDTYDQIDGIPSSVSQDLWSTNNNYDNRWQVWWKQWKIYWSLVWSNWNWECQPSFFLTSWPATFPTSRGSRKGSVFTMEKPCCFGYNVVPQFAIIW